MPISFIHGNIYMFDIQNYAYSDISNDDTILGSNCNICDDDIGDDNIHDDDFRNENFQDDYIICSGIEKPEMTKLGIIILDDSIWDDSFWDPVESKIRLQSFFRKDERDINDIFLNRGLHTNTHISYLILQCIFL